MSDIVRRALATIVAGGTLDRAAARAAMGAVMDGEATPSQLAALLVALRMRGETIDELVGFASAMRERVLTVVAPPGAIDVVGTGGDAGGTFNISTATALVVAAAGVPVAKHGNRAITSASGSSDVLDALGVAIQQSPEEAAASLAEEGFTFLFAPVFHPAMRHAGPTRGEIGVRTAFNLLGPLTNPAGVGRELLGVAEPAAAELIARVALELGTERTMVVCGDGVDELPLDGSGRAWDVTPNGLTLRTFGPDELAALGLTLTPTSALAGGSPADNARIVEGLLSGEPGPRREVVTLNAAAALEVAGAAGTIADGLALARDAIDSGAATARLAALRERRRRFEAARAATVAETPA